MPKYSESTLLAACHRLEEELNQHGGYYEGEPGHVLAELALLTGLDYRMVSVALLHMEAVNRCAIERKVHPYSQRSNRIVAILLA